MTSLILLVIFIILFCIVRYLKNRNESLKVKEPDFTSQFMLKVVNQYYINNMYYSIFALIIYFFFSIIIFIILRYLAIGSSSNIQSIIESLKTQSFILITLIILCIFYFYKIIDLLFKIEVIKLHFYLYQFDWYIQINDNQRDNFYWIDDRFLLRSLFLDKLIKPLEYVLERYTFYAKYDVLSSYMSKKKLIKLHKLIHSNKILLFIIPWLQHILCFFGVHSSRFLYYIPHSLVCITLVYEIYSGELHYIYHVLFIYVITSTIKKIRKFLHEKDPMLDDAMCCYFYKNSMSYAKIQEVLQKSDQEIYNDLDDICTPEMQQILYNEELFVYLQNDYKVYYILDPIRAMNSNLIKKKYRRIHIMLLLLFGSIYISYNHTAYTVLIKGLNIHISIIILLLPLLLLPFIHKRITMYFQEEEFTIKQNTKYYICFIMLALLYACIILTLILKNKLFPLSEGILWDWLITITQQLTVQEKINFLIAFFKFQTKEIALNNLNSIISQKSLDYILNYIILQIDYTDFIDANTTTITIKDYAHNLILTYISQERMYIINFREILQSVLSLHYNTPQPIAFLRNTIIILTCSYFIVNTYHILQVAFSLSKVEKLIEIVNNIIKWLI